MKATKSMTFGENDLLNDGTKQVGVKHNLGIGKIDLPHNQENLKPIKKVEKPATKSIKKVEHQPAEPIKISLGMESTHNMNIATLTIIGAGVGWFLFR